MPTNEPEAGWYNASSELRSPQQLRVKQFSNMTIQERTE